MRRRVKEHYFALENNLWRVEGFPEPKTTYISLADATHRHSLGMISCNEVKATVPRRINHLLVNRCQNVTLRLRDGLISTAELVNATSVRLEVWGPVPVIQIDMCRDVLVVFKEGQKPPKTVIVNASNANVSVQVGEQPAQQLQTDLLGEQFVSHWSEEDGRWDSVRASHLKEKEGGYLLISQL